MIDGNTRLFGIVADPVSQVRTPEAINAIFERQAFNGVLVPFHVSADRLPAFFDSVRAIQNFNGFVVTVPHKQAAVGLCDEVSDAARLIGAVNVVRRESDGRLVGEILDGKGFVAGLQSAGIELAGKRVLLLGAGGAANAIAFALAEQGIMALGVYNRTPAKVDNLRARLRQLHAELDVLYTVADATAFDLVVNATSLGMAPTDALPLDVQTLQPRHVVAEIIMKPQVTPLLAQAMIRGCTTHEGWPMLASQAPLMAHFMGMDT